MNKYLVFTRVEKNIEYLTGKSYDFEGSFLSDSNTVVILSDVEIFLSQEDVIKRYSESYHSFKFKESGMVEKNIQNIIEFFSSEYHEYEIAEDCGDEEMIFKIIHL